MSIGAGQAEVQDLADDVGRLEEELTPRETLSRRLAAAGAMLRRRLCCSPGFERDQDLAVGRSGRGAVAERQIDAAVGRPMLSSTSLDFVARN